MANRESAAAARRRQQVEQVEDQAQTYDNMVAVDGSRKEYCPGCGGPRDVEYAKTHPCVCCGSYGTQKTQPLFDDLGDVIPAEEVERMRAQLRAERAAQRELEKAAVVTPHIGGTLDDFIAELPVEEQEAIERGAAVKIAQLERRERARRATKPVVVPAEPKPTVRDLFLSVL